MFSPIRQDVGADRVKKISTSVTEKFEIDILRAKKEQQNITIFKYIARLDSYLSTQVDRDKKCAS